jgi:hypothetical protein
MARPKGAVNRVLETELTNEDQIQQTVLTELVEAKITPKVLEEMPLKKGDLFLIKVDGVDTYWTRIQLSIAYARNNHAIEIPKGSEFIPPVQHNCKNCG